MTVAVYVVAGLVLVHMVSLAEQAGARYWAPKAALYFKVAPDEGDPRQRPRVRYIGKAVRPAQRQSGHQRKAASDGENWRQGDMLPLRWCWTERQAYRVEKRRILVMACWYRWRKLFRPRQPSRMENKALNRRPQTLAELAGLLVFFPAYVAESFVYGPSRTWVRPRRRPTPVAVFDAAAVPEAAPPAPAALPSSPPLGPGRSGLRPALPTTSWVVEADGSASPVAVLAPPPPIPAGLTASVSCPAERCGGGEPGNPGAAASVVGAVVPSVAPPPPPPPVPVKAGRRRRPRPAGVEAQP